MFDHELGARRTVIDDLPLHTLDKSPQSSRRRDVSSAWKSALADRFRMVLVSGAMLLATAAVSGGVSDQIDGAHWGESGIETVAVLTPVVEVSGAEVLEPGTSLMGWTIENGPNGLVAAGLSVQTVADVPPANGYGRPGGGLGGPIGFNGPDLTGAPESHLKTQEAQRSSLNYPCPWCCPPHICGINGPDMTGLAVLLQMTDRLEDGAELYPGGWGGGIGFNGPDLTGAPEIHLGPQEAQRSSGLDPCRGCCPPWICGFNGPDLTAVPEQFQEIYDPSSAEEIERFCEICWGGGGWQNGPDLTGIRAAKY